MQYRAPHYRILINYCQNLSFSSKPIKRFDCKSKMFNELLLVENFAEMVSVVQPVYHNCLVNLDHVVKELVGLVGNNR